MSKESTEPAWDNHNFTVTILRAAPFYLHTAQKTQQPGAELVIYIEGDGHSWVTKHQVSTDPTPRHPLVRHLALRDPRPNVAYLARPCQFIGTFQPPCNNSYWMDKRFAPDVISAMNNAVTQLKNKAQASRVTLVGYSGGGAVAALVAAQRSDVTLLITIAGNLDTMHHSDLHGVSTLDGSLNPRQIASRLSIVKQRHYVGLHDTNVPLSVTERFVNALPPETDVKIIPVQNATHTDGWDALDLTQGE